MEVQVNIWGVILAAVSSMVVGMIWYAKPVFGKDWQKMAKLSDKDMQEWAPFALVVAFGSSLVMAYVLAHFSYLAHSFLGNSFFQDTLMTGLWAWVGFQGLRMFMHDQFERRRKKLSVINAGNDLLTILVMAALIGVVGL